ncbi:MAG: ABC transporter permease [Peptococcaceae bacterium]|nr:ABC transporter permease [Peptococcaceae bacterium]
MAFNSVRYILVQGLVSLKRNLWLSLASILTVAVSLILLGSSIIFLANTATIAKTFESQVQIAVFLDDKLNDGQVVAIQNRIKNLPGIESVTLTTKEQALWEFQESMSTTSLLEDLGGINPFPDKITIVATDPKLVQGIASQVEKISGVESVRYGQGILEKLLAFTNWLRWIGVAVVAAFTFAALLLISLSIKTNVNSREKEIQIMRLVGASNSFIRWPFIIEGLVVGLVGALVAVVAVGFAYSWLLQYIISTLAFIPVVANQQFLLMVFLIMMLGGMLMGTLASVISVRKFLRF